MPKEDNFIVAIELGSSKVTAIAGRKESDGAIQILAYAQEPSESFIRKGRINNFTKMNACLKELKRKLETTLQKSISAAYVGIGGMGMHTVSNTVKRSLGEKQIITDDIVNHIKEANSASNGDRVILDVIPQDYKLGAQTVSDPVGIAADSIEGHFLNIVAKPEEVIKCFHEAGLSVVGRPISVLALADAMLTEPEKRSGCVFVDMGAETTSVAVYKNNILRHLAVIPLGGASVNRDICTLQIEDSEAEALKCKYASACYVEGEEDKDPIALKDGRSVKFEEFGGLVEARMEEIISNISNQIKLSNYGKSELIAGIIITGGASNMEHTDKAFTQFTGFDKVRFVKSLKLQHRLSSRSGSFNSDGSYNTAIALIDKGEFNCCGGEIGNDSTLFPEDTDTTQATPQFTTPAGTQTQSQTGTTAATAAAEAPVEEPKPEKPKKPGWFKKMFNQVKDIAETMVSDEERFEKNNEKSEK